jgi:hypothetical protein
MQAKSIKGNSTAAIKTALDESMAGGYKPTLAFVFLTVLEDIDAVSAMMDAKGISVFGASTSDKFTEEGIEQKGIVVLLMDMNPANFKIVLKDFKSSSVYETACQVGEAGKNYFHQPAFIISVADIKTPGEEVIRGLLDKAGEDVSVIGGMAGSNADFTWAVFTNTVKTDNGLLSLIVNQEKVEVKGTAVSGWKPVGTAKKITKSKGPWIFTIDNEPAMDVIKKFLGRETTVGMKSEGIVPLNIDFPIQVQRDSGNPVMMATILWNTEDQSIMVSAPVKEGSLFRFSLPPDLDVIDTVIESSRKIKNEELPDADAMLIFSCIGRLLSLGPMLSSELDGLAATWNKPMAGFFSLGEFGKVDNGQPEVHGTTVSWVALKEK